MATSSSGQVLPEVVQGTNLAPDDPENFQQKLALIIDKWKGNGDKITILLTGKSGAGKSSLANGILGNEGIVAEEGDFTVRQDGGVTRTVASYSVNKCGVPFIVIDSPGLQDLDHDELSDEKILGDIKMKLQDNLGTELPDLVIYCIPMNLHRLDVSDVLAMKHFTKQFTPDLWKRTIFVLTFANCVRIPSRHKGSDDSIKKYFETHLSGFRNAIKNALEKAGCTEDITENIKVVPAGYYIPNKQDIYSLNAWKLPGIEDWFSNLWNLCISVLSDEKQFAMFFSQAHRIRIQDSSIPVEPGVFVADPTHRGIVKFFTSNAASAARGALKPIVVSLKASVQIASYLIKSIEGSNDSQQKDA